MRLQAGSSCVIDAANRINPSTPDPWFSCESPAFDNVNGSKDSSSAVEPGWAAVVLSSETIVANMVWDQCLYSYLVVIDGCAGR